MEHNNTTQTRQEKSIEIIMGNLEDAHLFPHKSGRSIVTGRRNGKAVLYVWQGNKHKPYIKWAFATTEFCNEYLDDKMEKWDEEFEQKEKDEALKAEIKAQGHPYQVGDVLYDCWGYEQTNIDFYQIVKVSKATIWIQSIAQDKKYTADMSGVTTPKPNTMEGDVVKKRVSLRVVNQNIYWEVKSKYGGCLIKYDGEPKSFSTYA